MNFIIEGGPIFMVPLLILLIIITALFIKGLKIYTKKTVKLINSISLFSFVFGILGFIIGLLGALESIAVTQEVSRDVLATGLKVGLLSPTFGVIIFLLGKLFSIILTSSKK
jgi:hypothetical protein